MDRAPTALDVDADAGNTAAASYLASSDEAFGQCRQRVISYLVKLNHALNENLQDLSQALVSRLCDSMVDYLFGTRFEVEDDIIRRETG